MTLIEVTDADFRWMLGCGPPAAAALRLPQGGVDEPEVLEHVRRLTARLHAAQCRAAWMMIVGGEIVGLCGFHEVPRAGRAEIGYSVAPRRRNRGHARAAVAAMIAASPGLGVTLLEAETNVENHASERVLEWNHFNRIGKRTDAEDGEVHRWARMLN